MDLQSQLKCKKGVLSVKSLFNSTAGTADTAEPTQNCYDNAGASLPTTSFSCTVMNREKEMQEMKFCAFCCVGKKTPLSAL